MGVFGGSAVGLLRVLLVATVAVPAVLLAVDAWVSLDGIDEQMAQDASRVCDIIREHAAKVLNSQELVARRVEDRLDGMDDETIRRSEPQLHAALVSIVRDLPQVDSLVVVGRRGQVLVATGAFPVARQIDMSDRDYFTALRSGGAATVLSKVQTSRITGKVFFGVAHRLQDGDGTFRGVVSIAVAPDFFVQFWETLGRGVAGGGQGHILSLLRDDGAVLALWPRSAKPKPQADPPFQAATLSDGEVGVYADGPLSETSEASWIYTYCHVPGYPAYAVAGRSRQALLSLWREKMATHLAIGLPTTGVLWLIAWTALQRARSELAALARMRAEMQRRETAEAALMQAQRLEAVGQLTGGVAHDFNNLLTIIMGNFEMIGRDAPPASRIVRLAGAGMAAARRGSELTAKLLAFSRRQMVRPEVVDVNRLLSDFRPVLGQAVTEAVTLVFDFGPDTYPAALDPGQLEAAVLNLLANARDAMSAGGTIRIATDMVVVEAAQPSAEQAGPPPGRYVRVMVRDDGPGMEPAVACRAFEPFFTTKGVGRGTGLGLSQVYGFCQQAGGLARITSTPGQGTTVELLLPRATGDATGKTKRAKAASPPGTRGRMVLVVEDEAAVLEVAVANLRDLGYETVTASDGAQALEVLRSDQRIDVLFSDVVMPGGIDGVRLGAEARRLRPGIKVLLVSGYPGLMGERDLPGDVAILPKPYTREDLATELAAVRS